MASSHRTSAIDLISRLEKTPDCFTFWQALRILIHNEKDPAMHLEADRADKLIDDAAIALHSSSDIGCEGNSVHSVSDNRHGDFNVLLQVAFLGLFGPEGTLPESYTVVAQEQERLGNDAFTEFVGIFEHRILSLLYAAYGRVSPLLTQEVVRTGRQVDSLSDSLMQFAGFPHDATDRLDSILVNLICRFSGSFSCELRPLTDLSRMLQDSFGVKIDALPFLGVWNTIKESDCTRVSSHNNQCQFTKLGQDFVIGNRFWDASRGFTVVIEPGGIECFLAFLPGNGRFETCVQLIELYSRGDKFDIRFTLDSSSAPSWKLGSTDCMMSQLGWTTLLGGASEVSMVSIMICDAARFRTAYSGC
ncbi:MAG: type VI secretion system baseplate subunit TssG [Planctomycetales bacterium]|jgi:type VI secretion system ImpH/TssG family protein